MRERPIIAVPVAAMMLPVPTASLHALTLMDGGLRLIAPGRTTCAAKRWTPCAST
jgi:hypothetical protein